MADHVIIIGEPESMCEHMKKMVRDRGYVRDPQNGHWLVKMCIVPKREMFRDVCGKIVPMNGHCLTCTEQRYGDAPEHLVELSVCHYRCPRCKWVTKGCGTKTCGHCGATVLTLLPPVINVDAYGFNVVNP